MTLLTRQLRPYSFRKGGHPVLFSSLNSRTISRYREAVWNENELSFVTCSFTSYLQAPFRMTLKLKNAILRGFRKHPPPPQNWFWPRRTWHFSFQALSDITASLAFKSGNLFEVVVPGAEIPITSSSWARLPSPRFKIWWFGIRERVRNFRESESQCLDISPIFQGDLTLKLSSKAKPLVAKRKRKVSRFPPPKKPKVCVLYLLASLVLWWFLVIVWIIFLLFLPFDS